MRRIKGAIAIAVVALSLSGCGDLRSLPDEERYQFINQVKDGVDLPSAGEIITQSYDNGDGVFSPSVYQAQLKGDTTYQKLKERIVTLSDVKDCITDETETNCKRGHVDIFVGKSRESSGKVFLRITDKYNGRVPK